MTHPVTNQTSGFDYRSGFRQRSYILLATLMAAVFLSGCGREAGSSSSVAVKAPRPNVIFILVDTLRADRLGCYGHPGGLSPMMDRLASEGVLFERAVATSSWTLPSVASFFCGYFPSVHKVTSYDDALKMMTNVAGRVRYFGDQFTTLTEVLRDNGYETAGFSANPFITRKFGFAQGFEHFDASFANNSTPGSVVNQAALAWLATRDKSRPFFLYLHYMDVHDPYNAADKYVDPLIEAVARNPDKRRLTQGERKRHVSYFTKSAVAYRNSPRHRRLFAFADYWVARYDSDVPQINEYLDDLRAKLSEMGLWDSAFVILTADHGESLGEHLLWAHGLSAHQDQLHVPLILRWPGKLPAGERIRETVRHFDVMPTVLDQLGITPPTGIQARALSALIRGESCQLPPAFAEAVKRDPGQKALVVGKWKLLAYTGVGRYELYDLDSDPTEQTNLANQHPRRVADMRDLLSRQMAENATLGKGVDVKTADISEQERKRFQSLGYFDEKNGQGGDDSKPRKPTSKPAPQTQPAKP